MMILALEGLCPQGSAGRQAQEWSWRQSTGAGAEVMPGSRESLASGAEHIPPQPQ